MPLYDNPEVQRFIEEQTGTNPATALHNFLPQVMPSVKPEAFVVPDRGTPLTYLGGQALYDKIEDKQFLKPFGSLLSSLGDNHGRSAALTALALGLGGAGFGLLTGRDPLVSGALGAGVGAGLGYGASALTRHMSDRRRQQQLSTLANISDAERTREYRQENPQWFMPKQSSAYYGMDGDPLQYIQSRLFGDSSIGPSEKTIILQSLQQASPQALLSLAGALRTIVGAGVGYVITRFLLNMGSVGSMVGTAAGGLLGSMAGPRLPRNAYGEAVDTRMDPFGHSRYVF